MEINENLVPETGAENVDATTTEEIVEQVTEPAAIYTEEQFHEKVNEAAGKRAARKEAKLRKKYDEEYGGLVDVLKKGTGLNTVGEITSALKEFYEGKGVEFSPKPEFSERDTEILAKAEADEIIGEGFDEVIEEAERLNAKGVQNMTAREKALFVRLAEHINKTETSRELDKIGVPKDVYESDDFKAFRSKFEGSKTPVTEIYDLYTKTQPKKEIKPMGSIKSSATEGGVKDYYTPDEISRMSEEDLANPEVWKAVRRSMTSK